MWCSAKKEEEVRPVKPVITDKGEEVDFVEELKEELFNPAQKKYNPKSVLKVSIVSIPIFFYLSYLTRGSLQSYLIVVTAIAVVTTATNLLLLLFKWLNKKVNK